MNDRPHVWAASPTNGTFWRAFRRLRDDKAQDGDLQFVLSCAEQLWKRVCELEPKAAAYDRMRAAYRDGGALRTSQRQAAACRAGGLTSTTGRAIREDAREYLDRWYTVAMAHQGDRQAALRVFASEQGIEPASAEQQLRRMLQRIDELLAEGAPDNAWLVHDRDALTTGPTKIPSARRN